MTRLVSSLAQLTEVRDRDALERTVASIVFDLIGPAALISYRVVEHEGWLRVRACARISTERPIATCDAASDPACLPLLAEFKHLQSCHESREVLVRKGEDGMYTTVFPVQSDIANMGLLELQSRKQLTLYQRRLIDGLLRVYCNYIKVLNASLYDQLTGLLNRRTFDEHLFSLIGQGRGKSNEALPVMQDRRGLGEGPAWLAVLDIDHFKKINDTFGHQYGDEVLVLLAQLLRTTFREDDRVFRFGGEEFVVVLRTAPAHMVGEIMERCRSLVEQYTFPQVGRVTLSIGYTMIRKDDTGSSAFGRADKALYVAKETGRNQALLHEALSESGYFKISHREQAEIEFF